MNSASHGHHLAVARLLNAGADIHARSEEALLMGAQSDRGLVVHVYLC